MNIFEALILGIVQGLTEFIPVSSSGHLVILHEWLGVAETGLAYDVALHVGTLIALLIYFKKDVIELARSLFVPGPMKRVAWLLIGATLPAVVAGYLLQDSAESTFRSNRLVAVNLIGVALLMLLAERMASRRKDQTKLKDISIVQAGIVGLAQAAAIVPGMSRSGSTITAGLFSGIDRVSATRFAFLLGIPITFGAIVKVMADGDTVNQLSNELGIVIVGVLSALAAGLFAIRFLLSYLAKHSLNVFAYYRIGLGLLVIALSLV